MAECAFGATRFEYDPHTLTGKVKIVTAEGSAVAVPCEDLLRFVTGAYVIPMRAARSEQKQWQDILFGEVPR